MAAPTLFRPIFSNFLSLLFLLLHLGCFVFSPSSSSSQNHSSKKRKHSSNLNSSPPPPSTRLKSSTTNAISSSWSYIKRIFSSNKQKINNTQTHNNPSIQSPCSSTGGEIHLFRQINILCLMHTCFEYLKYLIRTNFN